MHAWVLGCPHKQPTKALANTCRCEIQDLSCENMFPGFAPEITASSSEVGWTARGSGQHPTHKNQSAYF